MDRGASSATVHMIAKSQTYWSDLAGMHAANIMDPVFIPDFKFFIFIEV